MASEKPVADGDVLKTAVRTAAGIFVDESALERAVGESGRIHLQVEIHIERGRPQWTKGHCFFDRRIDMGGH